MSDPFVDPVDFASPPQPAPASPGWMITFADLLSLLLSFFVLMFATTAIDHQEWVRVMQPVTVYFGGKPVVLPGASLPPPAAPAATLDMNYLTAALRQLASQDPALAGAVVQGDDRRASLSLPAALLPCHHPVIAGDRRWAGLATLLGNVDNQIEVAGHVGLDPTARAGPEAWAGALALADHLADQLHAAGVTRAIARTGRADLPGGSSACAAEIILRDATSRPVGGDDRG